MHRGRSYPLPSSSVGNARMMLRVKLIVPVELLPSPQQAEALLRTLEVANDAANAISAKAWETRTFERFNLHHLVYRPVRAETGLAAQVVVRLIAKVADALKTEPARPPRFRRWGSLVHEPDLSFLWSYRERESARPGNLLLSVVRPRWAGRSHRGPEPSGAGPGCCKPAALGESYFASTYLKAVASR